MLSFTKSLVFLGLVASFASVTVAAPTANTQPLAVDIDGRPTKVTSRALLFDIDGPNRVAPPPPTPRTNAARLAMGLPLIRPKRLFSPDRVVRPRTSSIPCVPGVADYFVQVRQADGVTPLGYVSSSFASPSTQRYGLTTVLSQAMQVSVDLSTGTQLNLPTVNAAGQPTFPNLGGVVGPADSSDNLSPGSYNYILLTSVGTTSPGAPPSAAGNSYDNGYVESAIWSTNCSGALKPQWINTDSSQPLTVPAYLPSANGIVFTGDFNAFSASFPGGQKITFFLVPA